MTDLIKLTCPSCGSRLDAGEKANNFICPQCGNRYLFKQEGNSISFVPILEKMQKGSTVVLGDSASVVHAENVYMGGPASENKKAKQGIEEKVECPFCGKFVNLEDTFRCKNCNRPKICLSHQDLSTYFCSDCAQQSRAELKKIQNASAIRWNGIASLILGSISILLVIFGWLPFARYKNPSMPYAIVIPIPALITGIVTETRSKNRSIFGWIGIASLVISFFSLIIYY